MIEKCVQAWDRFFFSNTTTESLDWFRKILGTFYIWYLLANFENWNRNLSPWGIPDLYESGVSQVPFQWWSVLYWTKAFLPVTAWFYVAIILGVLFTIGKFPRWMACGIWLIQSATLHRAYYPSNAEDTILRMWFFYSMFLPFGKAHAPLWSFRLVQFHLLLIYAVSTPLKLYSDEFWRQGETMYYVFIHPAWSRVWDFEWYRSIFYHDFFVKLATWGSLVLEGSMSVLIWFKRLRLVMIVVGIGFHVILSILLQNVAFFSLATAIGYILFLKSEDFLQIRSFLKTKKLS